MNMDETAVYVNDKLEKGYSIAKAERELNYGKDTLRKKLNRAGYNFDKSLKKFILSDNTNITHSATHNITYAEKNGLGKKNLDTHKINSDIRYTEKSVITNSITHKTTQSKFGKSAPSQNESNITQDITLTEKPPITQKDNTNATQPSSPRAFTDEDFNILFEIIDSYKLKKKNININIPRENSEVVTRSFRSYKTVLDKFSEYCKDNDLVQKDAVADALISYMSK